MNYRKLIFKSLVAGFALGTLFLLIAPLGLGIYFIEVMRPALTPGITILQLLGEISISPVYLIFSLLFNGLFYSILILIILLTHSFIKHH